MPSSRKARRYAALPPTPPGNPQHGGGGGGGGGFGNGHGNGLAPAGVMAPVGVPHSASMPEFIPVHSAPFVGSVGVMDVPVAARPSPAASVRGGGSSSSSASSAAGSSVAGSEDVPAGSSLELRLHKEVRACAWRVCVAVAVAVWLWLVGGCVYVCVCLRVWPCVCSRVFACVAVCGCVWR